MKALGGTTPRPRCGRCVADEAQVARRRMFLSTASAAQAAAASRRHIAGRARRWTRRCPASPREL
eukprot:6174677-Pleurochrysis_carterae.AAC.6